MSILGLFHLIEPPPSSVSITADPAIFSLLPQGAHAAVDVIADPAVITLLGTGASRYDESISDTFDFAESLPIAFNVALSESMALADLAPWIGFETVSQSILLLDFPKVGWGGPIADTFDMAETITSYLAIIAREVIVLQESLLSAWQGVEAIQDSFNIGDLSVIRKIFTDVLAESLIQTDSITDTHGKVEFVAEVLALVAILTPSGESSIALSETIQFLDVVLPSWLKIVSESLDFADSVAIQLVLEALENLILTDSVPNIGQFAQSIAEAFDLADIAGRAWEMMASDSFDNVDSALVLWIMTSLISDSFDVADTATDIFQIQIVNAETLDVADTTTNIGSLYALLEDGLSFEVTIVLDGEVWQCWVLNTDSLHPSIYSGFNFNSFTEFNGKAYGAKDDGIYLLEGADDAGVAIRSGIQLKQTTFGIANRKRLRVATFGVSGATPVLKVTTEEGVDRYYTLTDNRATIERDVVGREWTLSLTDWAELRFMEIFTAVMAR